jgi:tRNA U34 2-thiouridine synthase MnmA/TrmU
VDNLCHEALKVGEDLRFAVDVVDFSSEYLEIVTNPRWGYGKNANPCIDCRIMMLRKAKVMMAEIEADFVFTGEVLGQRPMTQHRPTLRQIERESGLEGYLLRPLSALKLKETEPELKGWVDRSKLKGFAGRSRKPQIALAKDFGLEDYPQPAGGCCFLTDPLYGRKFFDYLQHLPPGREVTFEDFNLLKLGRHLRLSDSLKVVVGRNELENNELEHYTRGRWALTPVDVVGPIVLTDREVGQEDLEMAARILARYSDGKEESSVKVKCSLNGEEQVLDVTPFPQEETQKYIFK